MTTPHPWHRSVFALILPDAIRRQTHREILRRLAGEGFRIAYFELLDVRPEQLDALYDEQITDAWSAYRYRLLDQLWALGPVAGLVLEDGSGAADPHGRLKALKGATDPGAAARGTIRRDLRGINAMLSFLHAADSPEVSAREAAMLFSAEMPAAGPPLGNSGSGTAEGDALAVLALGENAVPETRGFREVLTEHRSRVIRAAWRDLTPPGRALAATTGDRLAEVGFGTRIAEGIRGGPVHPAAALLGAEWRPGLPALAERSLLRHCAALGVECDAWTRIVLLTSAYFAPNPEA
jgi:nucleoside diphosphate kinase